MERKKVALIIGAGPAGLTAAYELLARTDYKPIIFEMSDHIGGISKTVNYKGNRIDIGGHRFFSKSKRVMTWWQNILPVETADSASIRDREVGYPHIKTSLPREDEGRATQDKDKVMLIRERLSRIFFLRKFFTYPVSLSFQTLQNLGFIRTIKIGISYIWIRVFPIRNEQSLEDFFINRFGRQLYLTFFKDYTEKVWGTSCKNITAEWGAQRIKGLSVSKAVIHAMKSPWKQKNSVEQEGVETSLIERFMYPKFGPGQLWEEVARIVKENGGEIHFNKEVKHLKLTDKYIDNITISNILTGEEEVYTGDIVFSTMPVKDLIGGMVGDVPEQVRYFITVGLLLEELKIKNDNRHQSCKDLIPDNWIYIQEREVKLGRLQVFNNWSPYLVANPDKVWLGLEYFCSEGDEMWEMDDDAFSDFAINELASIDIIDKEQVVDSTIIRVPKTYPSYFGTYNEFDLVKKFVIDIENLHLLGRNGMHKYNNMDHSMLTAMITVDNLVAGHDGKQKVWDINTEEDYHEKG